MKNLFKVTLLMVAMFSMIACGSNASKNVNKVAQMVEAMESGDFEKAAAIEQEIQEWYDNASSEEIEEFEQRVSGLAESVMAEFGDAYEDVFENVSNNYNDVMKITEEMGDSYEDAIEAAEKAYNDVLNATEMADDTYNEALDAAEEAMDAAEEALDALDEVGQDLEDAFESLW